MRQNPSPGTVAARARLTLLAAGLAVQAAVAAAQGERPAGVAVETVETRELTETVPVFADVVAIRDGTVAARVAGSVSEVHALEGLEVAEGDLLVELDTELLEIQRRQAAARLAEAEAGIDTAEARLDRLQTALRRIEGLRGTASFSEGRFDEAQGAVLEASGQLSEAQARRGSAEADVAEVNYRLENARIRAPFPGILLEVAVDPGEFIPAGAPVARLLDVGTLEVEASVPADIVGNLAPGMTVMAATDGTDLPLQVRALLPVEEGATRTRPVRFTSEDFDRLPGRAVGQSLTVRVPVAAPREVLAVPKDALVQAQGGWTVFVATDGAAEPRPVRIGTAMGDRFEVLSGLTGGEAVVVRGNERLRPGQPVEAMPASDGAADDDGAAVAN